MPEPAIVDARGARRSLSALLAAADVLAAELPAARPGSQVAFAFENDHAAFVVALWASWLRGHVVALPVDARRQAVGPTMQAPAVAVFVHDTGAGTGIRMVDRSWPEPGVAAVRDDIPYGPIEHCVPDAAGLLVRTRVTAADLRSRLAAAAAVMPLPERAVLVVTLPAGNLAAFAPAVLLPLQLRATVVSACGRRGDALLECMRAHAATDLLTSPDVLRELAGLARGAFAGVQRVHAFGPVDRAVSLRLQQAHGVTVHELLPRDPVQARAHELGEALRALPGVDDAAVVQRAVDGATRTFALVATGGERAPVRAAARAVLGEPTARVAITARLVRDAAGSVADTAILFACGVTAEGGEPAAGLAFGVPSSTGGQSRIPVQVPRAFHGFAGHFPGHPVLSGSVQLHDLVQPALALACGQPVAVAEYAELKFLARIDPGDALDVTIERAADGSSATFVVARGELRCTTGRAVFRAAVPGGGA